VLASIVRHRNRLQFPTWALREELRIKKHLFAILLGIAAALYTPYATSADLIFDSSLGRVAGSGLVATVSTILRIHHPGNTTTESASVSRPGGADVKSDTGILTSGGRTNVGNVKTGASQTLTQTLGGNGITQASHSAVVFNADEPSGNSVTLPGLRMSAFSGNNDIFDAHLAASVSFATTFAGIGKQSFRLDAPQATALQGLLNPVTPATVATLHINLSASASNATDDPETFNLATITPVPEPGTLVFVGTALAGLGVWGRKRLLNAFAA